MQADDDELSRDKIIILRILYIVYLVLIGILYQYLNLNSRMNPNSFLVNFLPASVGSAIAMGFLEFDLIIEF